ncbi:MAG: hypothetical protein WCR72_13515 [Bacteroidota bacterium]
MNKLTLLLTRTEWQQLAAWMLTESTHAEKIDDKYMRALLYPLLKQVYVKLHNKLHSLQQAKNRLNLTLPEASVLATTLLEIDSNSYLVIQITGIIDQKLT